MRIRIIREQLSKTAVGGSLTLHVGIETAFGGIIAMSLLFSPQLRRTAMQFVMEKVSGHTLIFVLLLVGSRKSNDTAATFGGMRKCFPSAKQPERAFQPARGLCIESRIFTIPS